MIPSPHLTDKAPPRLWGKSTLCREYIRYTCTCRRTLTDTPNNVCPPPKDSPPPPPRQISACRRPSWSPPCLLSSGFFLWLPLAIILWPPVCPHPLPLLSLVQCWGLGSLQAWGGSPLLPSHFVHPLFSWRNEHIISRAPRRHQRAMGAPGTRQRGGSQRGGLSVYPSASRLHAPLSVLPYHASNDPPPSHRSQDEAPSLPLSAQSRPA